MHDIYDDFNMHELDRIDRSRPQINRFIALVEDNFGISEREKIYDALDLMIYLHAGQDDRADGLPYITHPIEVASKVIGWNVFDMEIVVASLLHDSMEDQKDKLAELYRCAYGGDLDERDMALDYIIVNYGSRVSGIVEGLTNPDFSLLGSEEKNRLYLKHFGDILGNPDTAIPKIADFSTNGLNLDRLPVGGKKENLRAKYGPVIRDVLMPFLEDMDVSHPLFPNRDSIYSEISHAYETQYMS